LPNTNTELEDIQDLNLSYLLLAQNLLRKDREIAIFRLKLSEQMADLLTKLSSKQMTQLARVNQLICRPVFEETIGYPGCWVTRANWAWWKFIPHC